MALKVFNYKRRSHLIKKVLWKNVKPVIVRYAKAINKNINEKDAGKLYKILHQLLKSFEN